jgi:hypothetical protein
MKLSLLKEMIPCHIEFAPFRRLPMDTQRSVCVDLLVEARVIYCGGASEAIQAASFLALTRTKASICGR